MPAKHMLALLSGKILMLIVGMSLCGNKGWIETVISSILLLEAEV